MPQNSTESSFQGSSCFPLEKRRAEQAGPTSSPSALPAAWITDPALRTQAAAILTVGHNHTRRRAGRDTREACPLSEGFSPGPSPTLDNSPGETHKPDLDTAALRQFLRRSAPCSPGRLVEACMWCAGCPLRSRVWAGGRWAQVGGGACHHRQGAGPSHPLCLAL